MQQKRSHNSNEKAFTDLNVYEASKARIHFCYNTYDEVLINCSGGKDSQVVVLLAKEVLEERGMGEKVKIVFYDQEFIYPETSEFIDDLFSKEWVEGYRLCLNMGMEIANPDGTYFSVKFWDESRKLFRDKPKDGIFSEKNYFDITEAERAVRDLLFPNGGSLKICQLMGVRAQESITRLSTILASYRKGAQCFLRHSPVARGTDIGTPIYDWESKDVWFFLREQTIMPINKMYYAEMLAKRPLRIGIPINSGATTSMITLKEKNPKFYELLLKVFPEIDTTARYSGSIALTNDYKSMIEKYGLTVKGIIKLINDITPNEDAKIFALSKFKKFIRDYIEFDRYKKYGHTYESALKVAFITFCKNSYSRNIMLRNKVYTKKELKLMEQQNEKTQITN